MSDSDTLVSFFTAAAVVVVVVVVLLQIFSISDFPFGFFDLSKSVDASVATKINKKFSSGM